MDDSNSDSDTNGSVENSSFDSCIIWRMSNFVMMIFFGFATYVQQNDPDGGVWMLAYGVPTFVCAGHCLKPSVIDNHMWQYLIDIHLTLCGCWKLFIFTQIVELHNLGQHITWYQLEEAREFIGLVLVSVWLGLCMSFKMLYANHKWLLMYGILILICLPFILWAVLYANEDFIMNQPSHCKGSFRMP